MFVAFGHRVGFIFLVCLLPCVLSLRQYGESAQTLYVAEDPELTPGRLHVINKYVEEGTLHLDRKKRETTSLTTPSVQKNISTWTTHLNDSHQQLMVHWVGEGSKVIICLARDSSPRNKGELSPSSLFISYDYGKNFTNKTESFKLGDAPNSGYAQLDKFFNHPKYPEFCVFVDSKNKKLYYTSDNVRNIHRSDLSFHPSELAFDEEFPDKYVILDKLNSNRNLYLTLDGGKTFKMIQSFVKSFFWSSGPGFPKVFYIERWKPDGTSTVLKASDPTDLVDADILFEKAFDCQIKGDYMFATKQSERNTLELYISHQRGPFYKAEFQTELDLKKFHIADVTDKRIFISVMHSNTLANLYVSEISDNFTQYNFVLSLEQILCYFPDGNWKYSWLEDVTEDPFTDLYRVEGLKGIYIASRVDSKVVTANLGPEHLISLITFDHGVTWSPINPPTEDENGKPMNCHIENSCSLHLCQKFSQLYPVTRSASIMSSKSAPGIIMATGVMGKSLKGIPGVYISRDAGLTWKRILKDYYFFNHGDHGGVLVAVKYFKSRGETRKILYSTNEGIEWNAYQFNADDLRIYGLMTEPGENTTTFTMFGSANDQHQWIIITIDLRNTFARNCTLEDYKYWSPSPPNSSISCVLGSRNTFQRRVAHTNCYNGIDYDRPTKKEVCECSRRDYECDFGFSLSGNECVRNLSSKHDPYAIPSDCRPGHFYKRTKGYRKIDGDVCTVSGYMPYASDMIPCPLEESAEIMLVALRDKIARIDLSDNSTIYPVKDQKNIVAIEFDIKNNCIYWADIEIDKIMRQCFNNGTVQEIVIGSELASIEGMALDWISNVLFFVDGLRRKIEAVRTDFNDDVRMRVTILDSKHLSKPRGITVHPKAGYLFWTDWDRNDPSVSRSNLDGTDVKKLFGKPIVQWPNGITIDQMSERVYWVDAMEDYIASSDMNGKYFRRILWNDEKVTHPFAVAVLKDKMYWDDWKVQSIFIADKDTGANVITINDSFTGLMDLKVFAHFVQHGSNACSYKNTSCDSICLGGPGNKFSCLCPNGLVMANGKCMCPDGKAPASNMTCENKDASTCAHGQFKCKNSVCISSTFRCDGNNDCGDMSDEMMCVCSPPMLVCDHTRCYLPHLRCDGNVDCIDMSDEKDCGHQNCTDDKFQCDNGHCIDKRWVCDGDNDCKDGSDERCTVHIKRPEIVESCTGNGFLCSNASSLCIPQPWVCDGERDCEGGEDELDQLCQHSTCAPYMFRCPSGKCIFKSWVCDGENDCGDPEASDEHEKCETTEHTKFLPKEKPNFHTNGTCLDSMFVCDNGFCLPEWWRCDGVNDCGDGDKSDEIGCGLSVPGLNVTIVPEQHAPVQHKCGKNEFTCAPGYCISLQWVCDGALDCALGEDEEGCGARAHSTPAPPACAPDTTPCADGRGCVADALLCDGIAHCADRSDEAGCVGHAVPRNRGAVPCPKNHVLCDDGTNCVPLHSVCDGRQDCYDGSDEANCSSRATDNTHMFQFLSVGVEQSSINSTSFLTSCWMAQQKMVLYSFLPSISKVSDGVWQNKTWTNDSIYRFTDLEPYTNYNVTFYIKDSKSNKTYASLEYVNTTTGEGVPSPPRRLSVYQMIGRLVKVIWDKPEQPRGVITHYTLYYAPPLPPVEVVVPAIHTTIVLEGYFEPNHNYSFWVTATNNAFTSVSSEVQNITFDSVGDVDYLVNASMTRLNGTAVRLEWYKLRGVDGYKVRVRPPTTYGKRDQITTTSNNITLINLPPGVQLYIDIMAYKSSILGVPFTIPLRTEGTPDETLNLTAILLKDKVNTVQLLWSPPIGERYKNKELEYEVHYTNMIHRTNPGEMSNDTKIVTKATSVMIADLHACESYMFTVGLLGGPLTKFTEIITRANPKSPVKNLRVEYDESKSEMAIRWDASCNALQSPVTYMLEVMELTRDKTSQYELEPSKAATYSHVFVNVPHGGRYNICVHTEVEGAALQCVSQRAGGLRAPSGVLAWLAPDGHLMVNWDTAGQPQDMKYEVVVSEQEIPSELVHASEQMESVVAAASPCLLPARARGPLYVAVRALSPAGYYSDLGQVHTLTMQGSADAPQSALTAVWWGAGAALAAAALLGGALLHVVLRHRRLARSFLRFTAHTPRYDSRRGQAIIADHDDDDVPPIHGFSDDEPLVIA